MATALPSWSRHVISLASNSLTLLRPTQPSTDWMENEYQLLLGVKSSSALVGLASNMWGSLWRRKHHIRQYCLQVAKYCKGVLQFIANEAHLKYSWINLINLIPAITK